MTEVKQNRKQVHNELMKKLFVQNHPYANLEPEVTTTDDEADFTPVVKISSKYQPDLDLAEYYNEWRSDAGPELYARDFRETSPQFHSRYPEKVLSPETMNTYIPEDLKPTSPVKPFLHSIEPTVIDDFPEPPQIPPSPPMVPSPSFQSPDLSISIVADSKGAPLTLPPSPPSPLPAPRLPQRSHSITRLDQINQDYRDFQEEMRDYRSPTPPPIPRTPSPLKISSLNDLEDSLEDFNETKVMVSTNSAQSDDQNRITIENINLVGNPNKTEEEIVKEDMDEIDRQLAILMNNLKTPMTATQQMCSKCYAWVDRDMLIERNGLFYMENCFNCTNCKINLANLPFELSATGYLYCQNCFVETQERCFACDQFIVGKVIKSNGKSFHPDCFDCSRCQCNLQHLDCTVYKDQIVCITCYHRLNAANCERCGNQIMPENGQIEVTQIKINNSVFCKNCFRCEDCPVMLWSKESGGPFYIDTVYCCKKCHKERRKEKAKNKRLAEIKKLTA